DKRLKVYSPAASFLSPRLKSKGIFALIGTLSCAFADATTAQSVNIETRLNIVSLLITFVFIQSPICFRRAGQLTAPNWAHLRLPFREQSWFSQCNDPGAIAVVFKPDKLLSPSAT